MLKMLPLRRMLELLQEGFQMTVAVFLASIGLKAFLLPNGFLDGGVTGIAILISKLSGFEISYVLPLVTLPFLVLGWYTVSKRTLLKSVLAVGSLALVIHFENFDPVTDDKLLIAIFGGITLGAGIGIAIKNGAVLDGSEILGIFINDRIGLSIGNVVLMFNTVLFGITALLISLETALYSVLTFVVTGKVIDFVFQGFEDYLGFWVISKESKPIQEALLKQVGTGITVYPGVKGFGSTGVRENMEVIQVILNRIDCKKAHRIIDSLDPEAFVVEFEVNEIKGGVLRKYLSKSTGKTLSSQIFQAGKQKQAKK